MDKETTSALVRVLPFVMTFFVLLFLKKKGGISIEELALRKPISISLFFIYVLGFLLLIVLIEFSLSKFNLLEIDPWNHPLAPSIIRIFGAVILAPIAEELVFRGLILSKLSRRINKHFAILFQAVLFVLLHNFTYQNSLSSNIGIVQSFIDATIFGYARFHTKSIYTSMTMHITGNLIATLERFIL